jgi:hypothetical protein
MGSLRGHGCLIALLVGGCAPAVSGAGAAGSPRPAPAVVCDRIEAALEAPPAPVRPTITLSNGAIFRWSDGDWVARVHARIDNAGAEPWVVLRDGFLVDGMEPFPDRHRGLVRRSLGSSTRGALLARAPELPESSTLEPGQHVEGELAWYADHDSPPPDEVTVLFGFTAQTVPLSRVPAPPAPRTDPGGAVGDLALSVDGPALTWRADDGDHIVRVPVTITNGTSIPIWLPSEYVNALVGDDEGSPWDDESSLSDPMVIGPGESVSAQAAWWFFGRLPVPATVTVMVGPRVEPRAVETVPVRPR